MTEKKKPRKKRVRNLGPSPADLQHARRRVIERLLTLESRVGKLEAHIAMLSTSFSVQEQAEENDS